jgi:hypothetical protein
MLSKSRLLALSLLSTLTSSAVACGGGDASTTPPTQQRNEGQSEFESAPPIGQGGGRGFNGEAASSSGAGGAADTKAPSAPGTAQVQEQEKKPEETDLYRVDGDRLYYLNSYRGLMVFDITNVDAPKLLGRSPVFGTPVEMFVRNGVATMVVGDWYGTAPDGSPFHGSVVRTVDAKDPSNMKVKGEVPVKGWARDMRVVDSNLFIVSEDYGWSYGYWARGPYGGYAGDVAVGPGGYYGGSGSKVVISSVRFGDVAPTLTGTKELDGYSGAFNVSAHEILLAHDVLVDNGQGGQQPSGKTAIDYIAFSQLDGSIVPMGSFQVDGTLSNWSADNGRWNIDLDGTTASVITCLASDYGYCDEQKGYELTTIDFSNASAPQKLGALAIPSKGWGATARFSNKRMYLSPREGAWNGNTQEPTPIEVYDLSTPSAPKLAGGTTISGAVWLFMPAGTDRVFALGNEYGSGYSSSEVAVRMLDVSDATQPKVLGTAKFGDGWAWTPASGTFKAFARDDAQKMIVLPFSGWSANDYMNGVQLIDYDASTITTRGAARSRGWVERGIFVKNRVVSLSDQALSVVDYSDRNAPKVVTELTLARNVVAAQPGGATIAQLSTDWYGYDQQASELRVLPIADAEESVNDPAAKSLSIDGTDARVFRNGDLAYVVTMKYPGKGWSGPWYSTPHVQVVDLSGGDVTPKGSLDLPEETSGSYWSWWGGCYYWDWYEGGTAIQVGGDALAFRRGHGEYDPNTGDYHYDQKLYVVDLSDPSAPKLTSTTVTPDADAWWGNMKVVGDTLYTTHYEYVQKPSPNPSANPNDPQVQYWVKYYLDPIDLSDRANPKIGQRINVPGMLIGASATDPSMLYFVDYRWYDNYASGPKDEIAVAKIDGGKAYLQSSTLIDGWVGNVFVRGDKAYMSAQEYIQPDQASPNGKSTVKLHELDMSNPKSPVDRTTSAKDGWGWLVGVEGDRAFITSGWGQVGLDVYKLNPGAAPTYSQFARTRGWWTNAMTRQGDDLFLASGYWGVQKITLK